MRPWVNVPFLEAPQEAPTTPAEATPAPAGPPRVFLALPTYNAWVIGYALTGLLLASNRAHIHLKLGKGSLLANTFNRLLCMARNSKKECPWTHWAMHHADISAAESWLDTMLAEMERVKADVLSAVVAIKDNRRITSTGTVESSGNIRRLTLKEVHRLPETFSAADLPTIGIHTELVVNTGLLLVRFDQPWADDFCFNVADGIGRNPDGTQRPLILPEDWGFSRWVNDRKLRLFATRKVFVQHWDGDTAWDNGLHPEGWDHDLGDDPAHYDEVRAVREAEAKACG